MPRFFFHVHDGVSQRDDEGTVLPDLLTARREAVRLSGSLLHELGGEFWNGESWSLEVTDGRGAVLVALRFTAEEREAPDAGAALAAGWRRSSSRMGQPP